MRKILVIILLIISLSYAMNKKFLKKNLHQSLTLADSIVAISKTIELGGDTTATIIDLTKTEASSDLFKIDEMIRQILVGLNNLNISTKFFDVRSISQNMNDRKYFNIILVSNIKDFKIVPKLYYEKKLDYQGFLIVAIVKKYSSQYDDLESMFNQLWYRNIVNVIILTNGKDNEIEVFTGFPYKFESNCSKTSVEQIASFKNSSFNIATANYFADKLKNLNGCALKLLYEPITPFYYYDKNVGSDVGFDVALIRREFN